MFDFWQKLERSTCEVYLRTHREDWFKAVEIIAKKLPEGKLLDIGAGDLHSTRQILAQAPQVNSCDVLEPNISALPRAKTLAKYCPIGKMYDDTLLDWMPTTHYDGIMAIHSNYYWGKSKKGYSDEQYHHCLEKILASTNTFILLGASKSSEYYDVVDNPFPEHVHIENTSDYLIKRGYEVEKIPTPMRFYVDDLRKDEFAMSEAWRFFNNSERTPTRVELQKLSELLNDKTYLLFQDEILISNKVKG